jgi:gas vesicle protein
MGYPRNEQSTESGVSAITWFLLGLGIGAGTALLCAPTSGGELRARLLRGCRYAVNGISRGTQDLRHRGSNLLRFRRTNKSRAAL